MTIIEIPVRLPGLNEYTSENRRNRFAGAKMKAETETMIAHYIASQRPRAHKKVHIVFRWREINTRRDLDNIAFAKKFILDALVKIGVLPGDGWKHVTGFADYFEVSKQPGVRVEINEVE